MYYSLTSTYSFYFSFYYSNYLYYAYSLCSNYYSRCKTQDSRC